MNITEIKDNILMWQEEFVRREGFVTCECSIYKDDVSEIIEYLSTIPQCQGAKWIIYRCPVCEEHHGEGYRHLELVGVDWLHTYNRLIFKQD
jgi:hypothetical protein